MAPPDRSEVLAGAADFLENIDAPFLALDKDLRISYLNAAAESLFEGGEGAIAGRPVGEALPWLCGGEAQCRRALQFSLRTRFEAQDAAHNHWYEVIALPSPKSGLWTWFLDVTARKREDAERSRLQAELEREHRLLQAVVDNAPAGIVVLRAPDFVFELVNPRYAAIAPGKQMTGRTFAEVWPEISQQLLPLLQRIVETGEPYHAEDVPLRIQRSPGAPAEESYFSYSGLLLSNKPPEPKRVLALVVETTQHVRARQRAEHLASEAEAILTSMTEGLVIADREGNVLSLNPAALRMFRLKRPEDAIRHISGFNPFELHYADGSQVPEQERPLQRLLRGEAVSNFEVEVHPPGGGEPWIASCTGTTLRDASGQPSLGVLSIRDTTEARKLEAERYRAQCVESLSVLAGGVAHTFNNLLTGIIGNISLASDAFAPGTPEQRLLDAALESAARAAGLAQQMLAYSGKSRFVVGPVDLSEVARETAGLVQASLAKNVRIRIIAGGPGPMIEADAGQIQQLVTNLVINAVESIGDHGDVMVATGERDVTADYLRRLSPGGPAKPGRFAYLKVQDSGEGMDRKILARIFDPFFSTKATGRGLGLAAVLGIVRAHQGAIDVESTPGRGAIVKVFLPAR